MPPIIKGDERLGNGSLDVPNESHPYSKRRQENQGRTNRCVFYMWAECVENKWFNKTGRWYKVPEDEILRLWNRAKAMGLASESTGAYLSAPFTVMETDTVTMIDTVSGDTVVLEQVDWYVVANKSLSREDYIDNILREIAYEGGVMCGINTKQARLGYLEANKKPYIVEVNGNPKPIAHATLLSSYDLANMPGLVASAGTYGENFGDEGIVYYDFKDLRKLFTPLGFTIKQN